MSASPTADLTSATETDKRSILSIRLSQDSFHQALSLVSKAVAKHGIQPVLSNVLLSANADENSITLAATDLDLSLAIQIPAQVLEAGQVTIPAQKLQELVSKLPHLELSLSSSDKALITLSCGRSKFEIKGLSAEQFPNDFLNISSDSKECFNLPTKHLLEASHLVSFASDKREVNSILNGICLEISSEKGLELAATDGSRLAYYNLSDCKSAVINDDSRKAIIPFRALTELSRMISGIDEESIECYLPSNSQIVFKTNNRTLSSSLIDGSYPKYQQLIPVSHNHRAIIDRVAFQSALERVSVLANERTKVVKLLFEEIGVVTISANTPDLGEAQDQLDLVEYNGQDFSIAFNVNYMSECLRNLDCPKVEIKMLEPLKPIIVSPVSSSNKDEEVDDEQKNEEFSYLYLLMPIQMRTGT